MTPNVRCTSRDLNIKSYFKLIALSSIRDRGCCGYLRRFDIEGAGALPLESSVGGCGEHLRLWDADPSGDIRGFGTRSLHPFCSERGGRGRQAGGRLAPAAAASLTLPPSPRLLVRTSPAVRSDLRTPPVLIAACAASHVNLVNNIPSYHDPLTRYELLIA